MARRPYDGSSTTGFVSPAGDSIEGPIDLSDFLDLSRPHRYPVRVLGEALRERGIFPGDVLIADAAAPPSSGRVCIAFLYVVVDGFHRYTVLKTHFRCDEIPVVVIDRPIQDRMAATVRHNRARGKHQVELMGGMVEKLLGLGQSDADIARHLGMEAEEVLRLKHQRGIASQYARTPFGKAWVKDAADLVLREADHG